MSAKRLNTARRTLFEQRLKDARRFGLPEDHPINKLLEKEVEKARVRRDFYQMPWLKFMRGSPKDAWKVTLSELNYILKRK